MNAESVVVYGSWVHEILPKLYSNVNGSFQQSKYNGGSVDGENSMYYRVGLSLSYEFTKLMSASVGYNWDQSDTPDALAYQSYNRNRVYIGLTAAY
ncbi:MAG: outer membrane beta-barrel protein [Verrucomicrobiota bacterium]